MAIEDDFSIAANGDIRYTGSGTNYTVLAFHRYLQDKADDSVASGDDIMDITWATPSERSTDNIVTLNSPYNIDDFAARYLYDGSITQAGGNTRYSGLEVVGAVETGTIIDVIQNNQVLRNFWGTGINADAGANIISRMLIKTRTGGADIDGNRLRVQARRLSDTYAEFSLTAGLGNSTAALFTANDLNNQTADATIAGWSTVTNTEGLRLIDVNNDTTDEEYYSEWDLGSQTINDLYERTKWLQKSATTEASNADTGSDFTVGNGTINGQGQSFAASSLAKRITKCRVQLKITGSPTGNLTAKLYAHTGTFGSTGTPTGAALATSETIDVAEELSTTYSTVEIRFLGSNQYEMTASTNYFLAIEYTGGDGSNYVQVRGLASSGTHAGNRAEDTGSWAAAGSDDLWFELYAAPTLYGMSGELFRGITHQVAYSGESGGPFTQNEELTWGSGATAGTGALLALDDDGTSGNLYIQLLSGVAPSANTITGSGSGATATAGTVTSRTISPEFVGTSTGSAIIGAYGVGIQAADLTASDKVFDLTNTQITPPNNVTFTVGGLVSSEDQVLVGPEDGSGGLDLDQLTLNTTLSGATETAVVCTASIPVDTPSTGTIRIQLDSGIYRRVAYTSYTSATFTIASTDFTGANQATAPRNVFVSYVDKTAAAADEAFTTVYDADRTLFVRVRDGGGTPIKTFETTGTLGSGGGGVTAIRTSDA